MGPARRVMDRTRKLDGAVKRMERMTEILLLPCQTLLRLLFPLKDVTKTLKGLSFSVNRLPFSFHRFRKTLKGLR